MEKVDRLGWTVGFAREFRGLKLGFRADKAEALAVLHEFVEPLGGAEVADEVVEVLYSYRGGAQRGRQRDFHMLYQGSRRLARSLEEAEIFPALQSDLNLLVGVNSSDSFCLRGGAVLWENRALIVLGPEGGGTSTLLRALRQEGAQILGDSALLLDVPKAELISHGRHSVRAVLSTDFLAGRCFRPRRLAAGAAALELFKATPAAAIQPQRTLAVLARWATSLPVFRGERGDSREAACHWLEQLNSLYL